MLRFVDVTRAFAPGVDDPFKMCAFLSTTDSKFVMNSCTGSHLFDCWSDLKAHKQAERLLSLVPDGFFMHELNMTPLSEAPYEIKP